MTTERISEGDFVLLLPAFKTKKDVRYVIRVERNKKFQSKYGTVDLNTIINCSPGTLIRTDKGFPFWIFKASIREIIQYNSDFKYKTQIIYPRDWGIILTFADIKPGTKVIEIGTGSGALTAVLSSIVGDSGKVISFERDPKRAFVALKNLEMLDLPKNYEIKVRDVAKEGINYRNFDVVFVDIPEPWKIIKSAYDALKPGGILCIYVPTYNQLQRVLITMSEYGFKDVHIIEHFIRRIQPKFYAIRPEQRGYYFSAYILFAKKTIKNSR